MFARLNRLAPGHTAKANLTADFALLVLAAIVASTNAHAGGGSWRTVGLVIGVALAVWVIGARVLRHYDLWKGQGLAGDVALTTIHVMAVTAALVLLRLVPGLHVALDVRTFLVWLWPTALLVRVLVNGVRLLQEGPPENVVVVGTGPLGRFTGEDIQNGREWRRVLGYLSWPEDSGSVSKLAASVLGKSDDLERVLSDQAVEEVYVAGNPIKNGEAMQRVIKTCEKFGVPFALPAHGFRLNRARPRDAAFADGYVHYLSIEHKPVQKAIKRLIDIVASTTALVLLSPILVGTAIAVKLTSRGPILFKQERVGMHGRHFHMLKFRSMVVNAEELKAKLMAMNEMGGPVFKMTHDPRVTRVGRFIRKYSIDELPQLINVLRGEMSLVGPRPPIPSEVAKYEPWQRRRLSVRPGLTCVWQVSGRNQISFNDWMYLDMQYIDHWSLGQDINLILKTVPVVLTGRGAS